MKRIVFSAALLLVFLAASTGNAQTVNSQVGGVVQDASKALIPGVTITLINTATSVSVTQLTNESGSYSFPVVPPGTYSLSAALTGFNTSIVKELAVGTSMQVRWNFTMEIGAAASKVEVSISALQLLTESSASIGDVLSPERVVSLPMVKENVLDLVRITPGFRQGLAGDANTTFAGLPIGTVNTVRDGLTVTDTRSNSVLSSTANINPDLVGEIRIILAPVDAEQGRGNGQILIQTRSGTNKYSGSAVWNARPSAFNANLWSNNRALDSNTGLWKPIALDWRNTHEATVSYGGPIIKSKMFFFALYDQNYSNTRTLQTNPVLTDTARQGIFRYFTGWNSGNALTPLPALPVSATTGTYPVVDYAGNPVTPAFNPNGTAYTGGLRCYSVFGNVKADGSSFTPADCPNGTAIVGPAWDTLRPGMDSTGYIQKILALMPHANFFSQGTATQGQVQTDGLNLAQNQFLRTRGGTTGGASGTSPELVNRKQLNVKIDENFNPRQRLSVGWTYQADNSADNVANWPNGFNGDSRRRPQVVTVNFTSTLTPRLINEARFGTTLGKSSTNAPWESGDSKIQAGAKALLLNGGTNATTGGVYPVAFSPGAGNFSFGNNVINTGSNSSGDSSPLYSFADTLGWTFGQHAFRMGAELRMTRTDGYSGAVFPTASGGAGNQPSPLGAAIASLPGQLAVNQANAANLLYFLNGSVNSATMNYWISSPQDVTNGTWQDYVTEQRRYRKQIANEADFFWKDDWKLNRRLTLNLGIRWEFFGQPYLDGGYTTSVVEKGYGLFGAGRAASPFDTWMQPGSLYLTGYGPNATTTPTLTCANGVTQSAALPISTCDPSKMTAIQFVGPGSDHPNLSATPNDMNNFG
ncbi:MAG TPA: carboxypeptidase-like regulatory domain-containing protein, partial [Terriglobia bacterium]|nr:carboxypeptidase-like regulatory domain-containing protein [Terriglobia bacterium]